MIVCSCNVLSDGDVKACLNPGPDCPRTPAQVYRCLGCSPQCGRCVRTIRALMDEALNAASAEQPSLCTRGCCKLTSDAA
ncbi:(2Fe-2S)-binding protein [Microvirga flavescens]|uniref:(2Fe-2S)-binding protein n=1 Tax=Microvirga flavescens TaxID=2249811 RepID=UPI000DD826F4|nr:(2Fe-2S)-binding protein [Microvirga flavescens]